MNHSLWLLPQHQSRMGRVPHTLSYLQNLSVLMAQRRSKRSSAFAPFTGAE